MKKITRSFILKTTAFILCLFCLGAAVYTVFYNILTAGDTYMLEETPADALARSLSDSVSWINSNITDTDENLGLVKGYLERHNKFEYYISINGSTITSGGEACGNREYYNTEPFYYIFEGNRENHNEDYNLLGNSPSYNVHYNFDECKIFIKFKQGYIEQFTEQWLSEKSKMEASVPKAIMLLITAVMCIVYLLWVCGRNASDDEVHLLLIDRMYAEINIFMIGAAAAGAAAFIILITDEVFSYDRVLLEAYLFAISAAVSAAAAVIITLIMSLVRNLKNRSFLKRSLTLCLIMLSFRLLKFCIKNAKKILIWTFGFLKDIFVWAFGILKNISLWALGILKNIFLWVLGILKKTLNLYRLMKQTIFRAVGGENKKIGKIAVFTFSIYTVLIMFLSYIAADSEHYLFTAIILALFSAYYLMRKLADADKIKEGIFEIRGGKSDFKIENVSGGILGDVAEAVNGIGEGIKISVDRGIKAERMKTELITNVSHDLKTPLTSIINYSELLCNEKLEPSEANDYAKIIYGKAERLKKLTLDLFDISKAQSGNETIDKERIDLGLLINQSLAEQEENIKESGLDFQLDIAENLYTEADGKKLSRVFENLIINALKYSMKGTRVYITAENKKGENIIEIKNIASYKMNFNEDEITERFVRGDVSRSSEGSGLGLAIAKSYTELCGGKFSIIVDGDLFKVQLVFA